MAPTPSERGPEGNMPSSPQTLQMMRAEVNMKALHIWAVSRQLVRLGTFDEGFVMHCLLTESFGHLAPKPFRLVTSKGAGGLRATLYGYGHSLAQELQAAAEIFADPLQIQILQISTIATKPMPSVWTTGMRLGFEVLVRPVVRHARRSNYADKERDVFQVKASQQSAQAMKSSREEVYHEWLSQQFQRRRGAQLEKVRLRSFQRVRSIRGLHTSAVEGPDAVMQGTLTIADSADFICLLTQGIGRHRAYGYGMLLLRPAQNLK